MKVMHVLNQRYENSQVVDYCSVLLVNDNDKVEFVFDYFDNDVKTLKSITKIIKDLGFEVPQLDRSDRSFCYR